MQINKNKGENKKSTKTEKLKDLKEVFTEYKKKYVAAEKEKKAITTKLRKMEVDAIKIGVHLQKEQIGLEQKIIMDQYKQKAKKKENDWKKKDKRGLLAQPQLVY